MTERFPELVLRAEKGDEQRFSLKRKQTRIGRLNNNEIIINDRMSSRVHARIREIDGSYYIADLDSRNGTKLNSTKLESEVELHHGDQIDIGSTTFMFEFDVSSPEAHVSGIEEECEETLVKSFEIKTYFFIPIILIVLVLLYLMLTR